MNQSKKNLTLKDIVATAKQNRIKVDQKRLKKAFDFANYAHEGATRYSGEPYITHPLNVANILASWGQDQTVLEAALLHDVVEDTHVTLEEIEDNFGEDVAFLVNAVTKVGKVQLRHSTDTAFVENLRKMFIAMAKDVRAVLVRLADRLHNMSTLDAIPLMKQERIARETLEVYAPLAERLGMGKIKGELEDLAFPYVYPDDAKWLESVAKPHFKTASINTDKNIARLQKALSEMGIKAEVHGRPKHRYSLYKKIIRPEIDRDINKITDLIALRVITTKKVDCYSALGVIHDIWKPVPHLGISDFIAQPKPNGYQSIHTKVFDAAGRVIEVQIRTKQMHEQAEYGPAAHFAYSEAKTKGASDDKLEEGTAFKINKKMDWVTQLARWQHEVEDSEEFVTDLKLDALNQRIYVFSPLGDVYDLPQGATPIDFAYSVHTGLLDYIQLAKVNSKVVPLNYALRSGDVVEIQKSKQKRPPSPNWLDFVKTSRARAKVKALLNEKNLN